MAEIPVRRTNPAPLWPWLLGLVVFGGVGLLVWALSRSGDPGAEADRRAALSADGGDQVVAVVGPPRPGNATVGIATATGADQAVPLGKPAGVVEGDETGTQAARDAAVTAATLAGEKQPLRLAGRSFVIDDAAVTDVTSDRVFWVAPRGSSVTYLAARAAPTARANGPGGRFNITEGMRLSLMGVVNRLDAERAQALSLDEATVRRAGGEGAIYLQAEKASLFLGSDRDAVAANDGKFDQDHLLVDERIFFAHDSAALTPTGRAKLGDIAAELKATRPGWQLLRIEGHADRRGPRGYNQALSRDRARAVEGHLATLGLKGAMLDARGYGESRPLEIDASTSEEYQRNRRVEFTIVRAP